jgi:hypothetical protein
MLTKKNKKAFNYFNVLAIFSAFFLFGFLAVPICSPIIKTNALSPDSPVYDIYTDPENKVDVEVKNLPLLSMTVNTNTLNITANNAGGFFTGDINITINTNNAWGYTLQVEDKDDAATLTSNDSATQFTSNFEGTKTAAQMSVNTWGYSLADSEYEDFSKIPVLNDPATIRTTSTKSFDSSSVTTFKVGINVDANIDPGIYADVIMFTTFVNYANGCDGEGFYCITTMQEMTSVVCEDTPTPYTSATEFAYTYEQNRNKVPRTILRDTRDDKTYVVSKLADGNCWMSQNLDLDLSSSTPLTSADTDINSRDSWTPSHSTDTTLEKWADSYYDMGFKDYYYSNYDSVDYSGIPERSYRPAASESYMQNGKTLAGTPSSNDPYQAWEKVGIYYNFYAATAGSGKDAMFNLMKGHDQNEYYDSYRTLDSICPKGWKLPDGWMYSPDYYAQPFYDDYNNLNIYIDNENISHANEAPLNMVYSGYVNSHYYEHRYDDQSTERDPISLDKRGEAGLYRTNDMFNFNTPAATFTVVQDDQTNADFADTWTGGIYANGHYYDRSEILFASKRTESGYTSFDNTDYLQVFPYDDNDYDAQYLYNPSTFHGFSVRCIAR